MDNFADTLKCGHPVDKYLIGFGYGFEVVIVGTYIAPHLCVYNRVHTTYSVCKHSLTLPIVYCTILVHGHISIQLYKRLPI